MERLVFMQGANYSGVTSQSIRVPKPGGRSSCLGTKAPAGRLALAGCGTAHGLARGLMAPGPCTLVSPYGVRPLEETRGHRRTQAGPLKPRSARAEAVGREGKRTRRGLNQARGHRAGNDPRVSRQGQQEAGASKCRIACASDTAWARKRRERVRAQCGEVSCLVRFQRACSPARCRALAASH